MHHRSPGVGHPLQLGRGAVDAVGEQRPVGDQPEAVVNGEIGLIGRKQFFDGGDFAGALVDVGLHPGFGEFGVQGATQL